MNDDEGDQVFRRAAELFGLLSTPLRLRVVHRLQDGEMSVGELSAQVGTRPSNLSQHLTTMYRCGLLTRRRDGSRVLYRVAADRVGLLAQWLLAEGQPAQAGPFADAPIPDARRPRVAK